MATAVVEERQMLKTLRWWDGFALCLANPGFLLGSLGYTLDIFGVVGSIILWGISSCIALAQAWIYSEPATMFPGRTGGISLYANEGWRKYTTLVGPVATFGYWIGWSVVLSIFGKVIGDLISYRWFPTADATPYFKIGPTPFDLSSVIAIVCIIGVWLFNVFGVKPFKFLTYITGALLMVPLVVFIIVPYIVGDWHSAHVQVLFPGPWGGAKLAIVYLFILAWSAYGTEAGATFAPEYRDTVSETRKALVSASSFSLLVFCLLPLGLGGITGAPAAATAEGQFYVLAFRTIAGGVGASIFLICLVASLLLSMSTSTSDAGRALFGISNSGLTLRQFGRLNRFGVPGNAMTLDLGVNICLVLFISSNLAILYMSNIGYVFCHVLALSGLLLLRKDRPKWPRPIKLGKPWLFMVGFLCLMNAFFVAIGAFAPKLNGYGNWTDFGIGVGILFGSILAFFYRRVVQDHERIHWRETVPTMPEEEPALAAAAPVA